MVSERCTRLIANKKKKISMQIKKARFKKGFCSFKKFRANETPITITKNKIWIG